MTKTSDLVARKEAALSSALAIKSIFAEKPKARNFGILKASVILILLLVLPWLTLVTGIPKL